MKVYIINKDTDEFKVFTVLNDLINFMWGRDKDAYIVSLLVGDKVINMSESNDVSMISLSSIQKYIERMTEIHGKVIPRKPRY